MTEIISTVSDPELNHRTYQLGDSTCRTVHSSIALATFRTRQNVSADVSLLLIHAADRNLDEDVFRVEAERSGIDRIEFLPYSRTREAGSDLLDRLPSREAVDDPWFDVTDADANHSVTFTCVAAYMLALERNPRLFHGTRTSSGSESVRLIDRSRLLRLPAWGGGVHTLRTHFDSGPASDQLDRLHDESYRQDLEHTSRQLQRLAAVLTRGIRSACSALPLEAGRATGAVEENDEFWEEVETDLRALAPGTEQSVDELRDTVRSISLDSTEGEKSDIPLTGHELERQFYLIERLADAGNVLPAYVLARELLVNGAILGTAERIPGEKWLDADVRERYVAPFYHLTHWNRDEELRDLLDDDRRRLARIWDSVKRRRNDLAHAGIGREAVRLERLVGRLEHLLPGIREFVLEDRAMFEDLVSFSFDGRALLHPYGVSDSVSTMSRALAGLKEGDTVYLLVPSDVEDPEETGTAEKLRDRGLKTTSWHFPAGTTAYEHWDSIWSSHRGTLLQNERIDTVLSGGTPAVRYACRKIYENVDHYGIHARQLCRHPRAGGEAGGEEEGEEEERIIILEECWPPVKARFQ